MIEVGPANTLASMAKKTLAARHSIADAARPRKREILCHQTEAEKIYEEANDTISNVTLLNNVEKGQKPTVEESKSIGIAAPQAQQPEIAAPASQPMAAPAPPVQQELPDVPVSAKTILIAIVSSKLKKPSHEINESHTIKTLTGGNKTPHSLYT